MTTEQLALLLVTTFAGGYIFGVTGFAPSLVASVFLHHGFPSRAVVFILVASGLVLNLSVLPLFWRDVDWRDAAPFLASATLGLPLGVALLHWLPAESTRAALPPGSRRMRCTRSRSSTAPSFTSPPSRAASPFPASALPEAS